MNKRKVLLKAVNERESDSLIKESLIRYLSNTEGSEDDKERDLETLVISILNRDKGVSIYSLRELANMYKTEKSPNGVTRQFLIKEIDKGNLKATKVSNTYIVKAEEARRYLATKNIF